MKKSAITVLGLVLLGAGVALVWPSETPTPSERSSPQTRARPEFKAVKVSSDTPSGLSVTGTVRDAFGKPIAEAEVFLAASSQANLASVRCPVCNQAMLSCPSKQTWAQVGELLHDHRGELTPGAAVRSDTEGRFRFENLVGVSFTVWAHAEGHGAALHERAAPGDPVELYLPQPRSVAGRVLDEDGRPLAGAHVHVLSRRLPIPREVTSGEGGVFEVTGLGEGPFYVLAEKAGFLPRAVDSVEAGPRPIQLKLTRPRTLEVEVVHEGKPVDSTVRLRGDHLDHEVAAKDGLARIEGLWPDSLQVSAFRGELSAPPQTLELRERSTRIRLELIEGGRLAVTLVDSLGQPVPDPEVLLLRGGDGSEPVFQKKARTGELVLVGPYPSGDYLLVARADGFKTAEQSVKIGSGEAQIEMVLSSGTFIRGRVLDEYGRPAPRISVLVTPTGDVAYADDQGQFSTEVPSPGFYELQAHHSDWGGGELQVTAPADNVELLLEPKAGLRVTVSSDGRRLEGADVVLWLGRDGSYRSDRPSGSDGVVLMRGMPPGRYSLIAAHRDFLPSERKQVELRDGELLEVSVELEPGEGISGEVVDQNGAPVAGAQVMAVPRGAEPTHTDGSGRFEIRPLRPDRNYRVEVHQSGFDQRERVTAKPGGEPLRIVIERRSNYRGRVVSEGGVPLRSFRVDEQDVTSPDGSFELPLPTESGRVFAVVEAQGYQPNMIDAPADQRDLGEIRLASEPQVQGRVVDAMGGPVEGASVTCDMCNGQVTSDANGVFSLSFPPRVGSVNVMGKKGQLSGTVTWKANGNSPLEVTLQNAVHVTGRVYNPDGAPAGGVQVEAIHIDRSEPFSFVTMQDGTYAVDLPEGSYRVLLGTQRPFGGEPITFVRVSGSTMTLDLGPAPGAGSLVVQLQPGPGQALWIVRGEVSSVSVPPMDLFKAPWAQMLYQPRSPRVVFNGLSPGRYTVVWSQFHSKDETPPTIRVINVPGTSELSLLP